MYFITGANGLVGSYLTAELLLNGRNQIVCGVRSEQSKQQLLQDLAKLTRWSNQQLLDGLRFAIGDILDMVYLESHIPRGATVFHTAASVSFDPKDKDQLFETNIQGTECVVNACLTVGVKKLCYVSSVAAIGRTGSSQKITEETVWEESKKNTHYAISKRYAELDVWRGSEEGLNMVIVNPTVILGYTSKGNSSSSIFHNIQKGFPFRSKGANGFVGAADVAKVLGMLADSEISSERFILSAENVAFDELFNQIAIAFGKPKGRIQIRAWMKWIVLPIAWILSKLSGKAPFVTKEVFGTSLSVNRYSADKLKKQTGFTFTPVAQIVEEVAQLMS